MSGTLRSRRRAIPADLLSAAVPRPTANVLLGLATPSTGSGFLTPRSAARPFSPLTPRLIPRTPLPQATALPTPIQLAFTTLYTTTRVVTETLTTVYPDAPTDAPMPTGMPVGMPAEAPAPAPAAPGPEGPAAGAAAAPNATGAAVPAAVPTLDVAGGQGAAAATDGGSVATIGAPGGNMSLVIGISGAGKFANNNLKTTVMPVCANATFS